MGLIRFSVLRDPPSQIPLYQSKIILNTLLQKSKHNYQALLFGACIPSLRRNLAGYGDLSTVEHQANSKRQTRLFSPSPDQRAASSNKPEPLLKEALKIYETSGGQTPGMLVLAYERGSYAQMMGFVEFADRVSGSVCRGMWEIEKRKLARLRPSLAAQQKNGELMRDDDENIKDSRDLSAVISCERSSQRPFKGTFCVGTTPGENWAKGLPAVERLVEHCFAPTRVDNSTPEPILSVLSRIPRTKRQRQNSRRWKRSTSPSCNKSQLRLLLPNGTRLSPRYKKFSPLYPSLSGN